MRILDKDSDKSLNNVLLYLSYSQALEFRDSLNDLLKRPLNNHSHVSSDDYKKEITVCIYDTDNLCGFNERSKKLIKRDE